MLVTQLGALNKYSDPASDRASRAVDFYSITRELVRSGLDINRVYFSNIEFPDSPQTLRTVEEEKPLWEDPQKSLLDWAAFLCDQGLVLDSFSNEAVTILIHSILLLEYHSPETLRTYTNEIFLLCLLKADVSIRHPKTGMQALHILLFTKWSADLSPHIIDVAYILIHFGGADVHAVVNGKLSPTIFAYLNGWWDEWLIVLDRCGLDCDELIRKENDFWGRTQFLSDGESTAVDTEDLCFRTSGIRRRPVVGDRFDE